MKYYNSINQAGYAIIWEPGTYRLIMLLARLGILSNTGLKGFIDYTHATVSHVRL